MMACPECGYFNAEHGPTCTATMVDPMAAPRAEIARLTAELAQARQLMADRVVWYHIELRTIRARAATAIALEEAVLAMVDARGMPVSDHPGDPIQPVIAAINASLSARAERERKEADHG